MNTADRTYRGNAPRKPAELTAWLTQASEPVLEPHLPIIDSHHHLWDDERGRYLMEELSDDINSGHNVAATVFVECGAMLRADGPKELATVGEVEYINGIAAASASGRYGSLRACAAIVARADLMLGDAVQPVLEALIAAGNGRTRGIRYGVCRDNAIPAQFTHRHAPLHLVRDPVFRKGLAQLAPLGLSFESWQYYPQLPDALEMVRDFPDTSIILNHAGGLLGIGHHKERKAVFETWRRHIRDIAHYPNLTIKLGGLGMLSCGWDFYLQDRPASSQELADAWRPYIETCIEAFGPDRCMVESNFPVDKQTCGYGVLWNAMKRITQGYSAAEKTSIYSGTAARVYRLETQVSDISIPPSLA